MPNCAGPFIPVLLSACISCSVTSTDTRIQPARDDPALQRQRGELLQRKSVERIPQQNETAIVGEVPDQLLHKLRRDLRKRLGHDRAAVQRAAAAVWPSGALGCPVPGSVYTQAPVAGYHVVFKADGKLWDYRLNQAGGFRLCERSPAKVSSPAHPPQ